MLKAISDRRVRQKIFERALKLSVEPNKQGKPLLGPLAGYRSIRAVGQRYRVVYRADQQRVVVAIVALGLRKEQDSADIYRLAKNLIRLGLAK